MIRNAILTNKLKYFNELVTLWVEGRGEGSEVMKCVTLYDCVIPDSSDSNHFYHLILARERVRGVSGISAYL